MHANRSAKNINRNQYKYNTVEFGKKNFIPNIIKARGSDRIAKEIIKKNQEVMDYNIKESENKYIKMKKLSKYSDVKLAIEPGKVNNPNFIIWKNLF